MSHFPIICTPYSLERAQNSLPPEIPFPEKPPAKPGDEPKQWDGTGIAIQAAMAAITAPIISSVLPIPGWLLFLGAVGAIAYGTWQQYKNYPECKQAYRLQAAHYAKELPGYKRRKRNHEEAQKIDVQKRLVPWRREQTRLALARTEPHDGMGSSAREGKSEQVLRSRLKRYFPGKIHADLTFQIPGYSHPYTPDIAYIDPSISLSIDIEVDEPYVYHTKQAIHYSTSEKDYKRNRFFVDKGWVVIRFSEQQVVCHLDSCCKVVAQQIAQITADDSIMSRFTNVPELPQQPQWTEVEANQMAVERVRDNYSRLCSGGHGSVAKNAGPLTWCSEML